jgi:hypothetical protein
MNDLKRDLTALFHDKADSVETPAVAPSDVLRRGRRRQGGMVLGTAAGLIAAGLVIFVVVQASHAPTSEQVGGPSVTPTATPTGVEGGAWTSSGPLPTVVVEGATKATFDAFDASWTITDDQNGVTLERTSGAFTSFHQLYNGQGTQVDVPGGTFVLEQTDRSVARVSASLDGGGAVEGAWMQTFRDAGGRPGRIWVVPLPGSGTGTTTVGNSAPLAMSWPAAGGVLKPGDVLMAGADDGVSWSLRWSAKECPVISIEQPKDGGTSGCLRPVRDPSKGISTVEMVANTDRGAMAFVVPTGLILEVTATSGTPAPTNFDLTNGRWNGTSIWVMPMRLGTTYTARARDASGQPVGSALTITPGSTPSAQPS